MTKNKMFPKALALSLLVLPGCDWFKKAKAESEATDSEVAGGSEVLLTINGKPALTVKEFEEFKKSQFKPEQLQIWEQLVPDLDEQLFKSKKQQLIFNEWAKKSGIRDTEEYKKDLEKETEQIRQALDIKAFIKKNNAEVTDEDAKKHYEENKTKDPRIVISPAGIKVTTVTFKTQQAANQFADKVKESKTKDLEKLAKSEKPAVTIGFTGIVNEESTVDPKVKERVLKVTKFPEVVVVQGDDKKFWVVVAKSKEELKTRPFEEVRETIKHMLAPKKIQDMFEAEFPKLEKEYNAVENKEFFEKRKQEKEQEAAKRIEEATKAAVEKEEKTGEVTAKANDVTKAA